GQIVSAVDGPIVAGDFGEPHQNGACNHEGQCVLLSVWAEVGGHMRDHLDSFSLADMVLRAQGPQGGPLTADDAPTRDDPLAGDDLVVPARSRA
ncbi:MAG: Rrf2 family transcriptional regulator, iron-sulfur cluster assembly transcription factor, partial [Actinomycetota bacterium]|nr:Rrf2 family transcriptional regulator, iron-sulfur cluster assembly transcription factor [Actinomycetota bacterium]